MTSFSTKRAPSNHVNEEFYEQTISATALQSDLDILSAGDQTEIGEKVKKPFCPLEEKI